MIKPGNIVLVTAGKEKGQLFVVLRTDQDFAYLADGKRLKADKPKKKSFKHIKLFDAGVDQTEISNTEFAVNAKIRKILKTKRSDYVKGRCD